MLFSEDFIREIEEEPVVGIVEAIKVAFDRLTALNTDNQSWNDDEHELLWEASAFIKALLDEAGLNVPISFPRTTGDIQKNCEMTSQYLEAVKRYFEEQSIALKVESYTNRYSNVFKSSFAYEFSQGDLDRIQELINELRTLISDHPAFEKGHKQRLLKRLEKLQSEIHKRVSDLDRFWGMVGDAGVVLGKFGKDAKPIVDRIRELAQIVWKTQARAEELPSDSKNPMIEYERE